VTVLVPCWNKGDTLGATVESLLELEYPKEKLSILIIDDGSTDNTWQAAQQFAGHPQVSIMQKKNEGSKFSALNFGLAHSSGELVGCLDADSFVQKDALIEIVKKFESDKSIMAVAPSMKVNQPRNLLELMQAVEYTFGIFFKKMYDNLSAISVLPGPFSFYRRELFDTIGVFRHAHHTEDMEMAFRMHAHGKKIVNVHTAVVATNVPTTLGALVRQRTRWSRGFLENSKDYSYMYFNPNYGNFGILVLPVGLLAFVASLYIALFSVYGLTTMLVTRAYDVWTTGVPVFSMPQFSFEWFYINTNMMMFVTTSVLLLTIITIVLGQRIGEVKLSLRSFVTYFLLFGFVAPLWLLSAVWDTVRSRERGWLT
jgi:cellulose synthase/poly-beta-1,6-N-acetylglucosamine synthase-like glycosyltransferase